MAIILKITPYLPAYFRQNVSSSPPPKLLLHELHIRAALPHDAAIQTALFVASRPELQQINLMPEQVAAIIETQQRIHHSGMIHHYPNAKSMIVECEGIVVGQYIIDDGEFDIRLIDLAVMPLQRRRGIASAILRLLQAEAARAAQSVSLAVRMDNIAAKQLYIQHGFIVASSDGLFEQMRWIAA
jgi:ribosomal protein S18 acetylase RimI-like enzyme